MTIDATPFSDLPRVLAAIEKANAALAAGQTTNAELDDIKRSFGGAVEAGWDVWVKAHFFSLSHEERNGDEPLSDVYYNSPSLSALGAFRKRAAKLSQPEAKAAAEALADRLQPLADALAALKPLVKKRVILTEEEKRAKAVKEAIPKTKMDQVVWDAVMAKKPVLEAEYKDWMKRLFDGMVKALGADWCNLVNEYPKGRYGESHNEKQAERFTALGLNSSVVMGYRKLYINSLRRYVDETGEYKGVNAYHYAGTFSESKLDAGAKAYAEDVCVSIVKKIQQKAGELENPEVAGNIASFEFDITGEHKGKKVRITQTTKMLANAYGTVYNQWPALIYVDGKFMPELAYKKWMLGKE